jgi:hypothetical protein
MVKKQENDQGVADSGKPEKNLGGILDAEQAKAWISEADLYHAKWWKTCEKA